MKYRKLTHEEERELRAVARAIRRSAGSVDRVYSHGGVYSADIDRVIDWAGCLARAIENGRPVNMDETGAARPWWAQFLASDLRRLGHTAVADALVELLVHCDWTEHWLAKREIEEV